MNFVNTLIYALGILVLIVGIGLGLKALYAFISQAITKRRVKRQHKQVSIQELSERVQALESKTLTSQALSRKVRKMVREYLTELSK